MAARVSTWKHPEKARDNDTNRNQNGPGKYHQTAVPCHGDIDFLHSGQEQSRLAFDGASCHAGDYLPCRKKSEQ